MIRPLPAKDLRTRVVNTLQIVLLEHLGETAGKATRKRRKTLSILTCRRYQTGIVFAESAV